MAGNGGVASTVEINDTTTNGPVLSNDDWYGFSITSIGDLNNDSVEDLVVGAMLDDAGGPDRGAVHISFLNTNGSIDSTVEINDTTTNGPVLSNEDNYGTGLASPGDLNDDSVQDIVVGAHGDDAGGAERGAVHISFLNTNGSIDSTVEINDTTTNGPTLSNGDYYGRSVTAIGDLNDDGVEDLVVGAPFDDAGGTDRGAVHVHFMNANGSVASTVEINDTTTNGPTLSDGDAYGNRVASPGDLNDDGVEDLVVGAPFDDAGGTDRGAVHIHFMNANGSIDSTVGISGATTNGPTTTTNDAYGWGIASPGDLNDDGVEDLVVGAPNDDAGGTDRGAVHIHFMDAATNDPTLSNRVTASRLKAGASSTYNFSFTLQNAITGTLTITFPAGFTVTGALTSGTCTGGTVGTFGFTSSTLTAVKTGCTAGTLTVSGATVTNHSTPGSYTISWVNDDPGEGLVTIVDDDQVTVTGAVGASLTFNVGAQASATACDGTFTGAGGAVSLGALTTASVATSDASSVPHICTRVSTNATAGAVVTVRNLNGSSGLVSTSVPADDIDSSTATLVAGTEGYGICVGSGGSDTGRDTTTPTGAAVTRSAPFNGTCATGSHAVGGLTTTPQNLWTISGPSQNAFGRVYVKAAIDATTAAHGDYTDTLTFVATGTY